MYCEKCHRRCPDNFVTCPYCSAKLKSEEIKQPTKFSKNKHQNKYITLKSLVAVAVAIAALLAVAAVVTVFFTGTKPETVVKTFTRALNRNDETLYFSMYDEQIAEFKKENRYYEDEETFAAMTEPLEQSVSFYKEQCGEDFRVSYSIAETEYFTEEQLESLNKQLSESYGYDVLPQKAANLKVEINVKGSEGTYKTVYDSFICIKFGRKWYKCDEVDVLF